MSQPINRSSKPLSTPHFHEDKPISKTKALLAEKITGHKPDTQKAIIKAAHGEKHPKVAKAINGVLVKPIESWEVSPVIKLMEIRSKKDVTDFTKTLSASMKNHRGSEFVVHYDLSSLGLDRTVQVLGNTFIPVRRSEHQEIHLALMNISSDLGIENHQDLTFVIIDDDLYESVMGEIALFIEKAAPTAIQEEKPLKRTEKLDIRHGVKTTPHSKMERPVFEQKWKLAVAKILNDIISQELHSKEMRAEKKEKERLKEEKCIKFALEQFERLLKIVEKEVTESRIEKWEESVPPFPIHSLRGSTLWRQLKSKMIEELLHH